MGSETEWAEQQTCVQAALTLVASELTKSKWSSDLCFLILRTHLRSAELCFT